MALQHLWKQLEKQDACGCAEIADLGHILRGQFVVGMKAGPARRAMQERIRVQPDIFFNDIVRDVVT